MHGRTASSRLLNGAGIPWIMGIGALLLAALVQRCGDGEKKADISTENQCPVDWEKTPSPKAPPADRPVYYSRPYFTTCKDGGFYSSAWMSYKEPITEYEFPDENWYSCRSGTCRDGICEDDLAFIEGKIGPDEVLEEGMFRIYSRDCEVCNPNNALYSIWNDLSDTSNMACDGGYRCCDNPMPNDGPCDAEDPRWEFGVRSADANRGIYFASYGTKACEETPCEPPGYLSCTAARGGSCVPGTSTLQEVDWDNYDCNSVSTGTIFVGEERLMIRKATVWMGNRKDFSSQNEEVPGCLGAGKKALLSMTYFTCTGAAIAETEEGRWFKAVWIHRYDPSNCDDKPCWMSVDENLPVEFLLTELPGEPQA